MSIPQLQPNRLQRRKVIQTLGRMSAGISLAIVGEKLLTGCSKKTLQTFNFETITVDTGGNIINRRKLNAKYFIENLGNGITLEMVQIPSGTFTMGASSSEARTDSSESPQHPVSISSFFMGKYEVTQEQYEVIMGSNPSGYKGINLPVEDVTWDMAVEFCKKLSQKTGHAYRLPSEAEWEYACRAGTVTPFYFGETITTDLANYYGHANPYAFAPKGEYRGETTKVDQFPPNAFGLYDMHGNVWEWCQDIWHDNYEGAPTDGSAWVSDDNKAVRVLRGGCWFRNPEQCRSANRSNTYHDSGPSASSFRLVTSKIY